MDNQNNIRTEEAANLLKSIKEKSNIDNIEEMIKDNVIYFDYKGEKYRVRLLNQGEKAELHMLESKKFGELIRQKNILFKREMMEDLKKREVIDIIELEDEQKKLIAEEKSLNMKLGEALSKNSGDAVLKTLEEQIKTIENKIQILTIQINTFLEFTLENIFFEYLAKIITMLSLEKLVNEKWERVFKTVEAFEEYTDEDFLIKAGTSSMYLQNFR